jgi:hypothetical protein
LRLRIKEDQMGGVYSTPGREKTYIENSSRKP